MSEEEKILDVFENTGDFGKYYLGDYSNEDIGKFIRNILQENKQLKEQLEEKVLDWEIAVGHNDELRNIELKVRKERNLFKEQLKQKDKVIDDAIKKCELEISASFHQYEQRHRQQDLCYKVAHERILKILNKYKGDE